MPEVVNNTEIDPDSKVILESAKIVLVEEIESELVDREYFELESYESLSVE